MKTAAANGNLATLGGASYAPKCSRKYFNLLSLTRNGNGRGVRVGVYECVSVSATIAPLVS